jgi:hypothetical protein
MRRNAIVIAVLLLAAPAMTRAQSSMYGWVGVGASIPVEDSKDAFKTGWLLNPGLGFNIKSKAGLSFTVEGLYGSSSAKVGTGSMKIYGALGGLNYEVSPDSKANMYFFAGGGVLGGKPEGGETDMNGAYQVGLGLTYQMNAKVSLFGDVRYLSSTGDSKITLMPVTFGLGFSF